MQATLIRSDAAHQKKHSAPEVTALPSSSPAAKSAGRGFKWGRLVRWIFGVAILAEAGWLVAPTILFRTSVRATITAPLLVVRISKEGEVHGTPPVVGTSVTAGQRLFELQVSIPDRRPSERIRGEIESIRRTSSALTDQIARLDEVKAALCRHFIEYRDARIAQAEKQAAEQAARVNAAASRLKTAESEDRMQRRLSSKGASADVELVRAENALVEARNELEVARHAAARQQLQLEAARKGFFVGESDGGQDRVASKQRADEIEIQQAGLRARLGELDGQRFELESRLDSEERYLAGNRVQVVAPISGVVWSSPLAAGSRVSPGSTALEIVNPTRLSIEATFRDADAERIHPGVPVKVRLLGSSRILDGHVVRMADLGAIDLERIGGGDRDAVSPGTFRAVIKLDEQPTGGHSESYDSIGGSAIVWTAR